MEWRSKACCGWNRLKPPTKREGNNVINNLEVQYLYRDGGNNKKYQSVVLANPGGITPKQLEEANRRRSCVS